MNPLTKTAAVLLTVATLGGLGAGAANAATSLPSAGGTPGGTVVITMDDTFNDAYGQLTTTAGQLSGRTVCADRDGRSIDIRVCEDLQPVPDGTFELLVGGDPGDAFKTTITDNGTTLEKGWLGGTDIVDFTLV